MIDIIKSALLGVIEGITEFLPISSTAHLILGRELIGFQDEAEVFTVIIQLGAILAAFWFFRKDLARLFRGVRQGKKPEKQFLRSVVIGLIPASIVGLTLELTIGLPSGITLIALALIFGGVVLWLTEKWVSNNPTSSQPGIEYSQVTTKRALIIGLAQCTALIPGISRSGSTIVGGLLSGVNRHTATAFSFYLSLPIMLAASSLKLSRDYGEISQISAGLTGLIVGSLVSFIVAFIVVSWLLRYVQKNDFKPFAYYRIVLGLLILLLMP